MRLHASPIGRLWWLRVSAVCLLVVPPPVASAQDTTKNRSPAVTQNESAKHSRLQTERQKWEALREAKRLSRQAEAYEHEGKSNEAERFAERALVLEEQVRGPWHVDVAQRLDQLADLYAAHKKEPAAERFYERARNIRERALSTHPDVYERDGGEMGVKRNQPANKTASPAPGR